MWEVVSDEAWNCRAITDDEKKEAEGEMRRRKGDLNLGTSY
jgi:hypothetical protein